MGRPRRSQTFVPQPSPLRKTWGPDNADTTEDEAAADSSDYFFTSDDVDTEGDAEMDSSSEDGNESPSADMISADESEDDSDAEENEHGPIAPGTRVFVTFTEDDVLVETRSVQGSDDEAEEKKEDSDDEDKETEQTQQQYSYYDYYEADVEMQHHDNDSDSDSDLPDDY